MLLDLFLTFAKVGVMTFGGGYAMLPILQREVVEKKKWATEEELADYFAIGQCTPGIIAVNTATFIGQKSSGVLGGIIATLGVVFPSVVILSVLAGVIQAIADSTIVKNAFAGIRVCVCVLIFNSVIKLWKASVMGKHYHGHVHKGNGKENHHRHNRHKDGDTVVDTGALVIFCLVLVFGVFTDLSPVIFVVSAAVCGIILKNLEAKRS